MTATTIAQVEKMRIVSRLMLLMSLLLAGCQPAAGTTPTEPVTAPTVAPPTVSAARSAATPVNRAPSPEAATAPPAPTTAATQEVPGTAGQSWGAWQVYAAALRPDANQNLGIAPEAPGDVLSGMTEYHMQLTLASDMGQLDGLALIRYTNRETTALDSIYLHLYPNLWNGGMTIADVKVGGQAVIPELEAGDSRARLPLPGPLAPGEAVELSLRFNDPIPSGKDIGNYGEFAYQKGVLALAGFYPTVAVYDREWRRDTPAPHGDVLFQDASLYDVTLTAPADLVIAATGVTREHQDNGDGSATWHLVGGPMRDFNLAASADFRVVKDQVDDITVNSYYLPQHAEGGNQALKLAQASLMAFQEEFGPYPYRELDVVATPTSAGGIEYPGMVVIAESLYDEGSRNDFFEAVIAHEVAHQWWYAVLGNDQLNDPWLDESTAQYATYLYYRDTYGAQAGDRFLESLNARWTRSSNREMPVGLPVTAYSAADYSAIVYGRGALFLVALENELGRDKMSELLRRYYKEYAWEIASPRDFQTLAEEVAGRSLQPLFEQWIYARLARTP